MKEKEEVKINSTNPWVVAVKKLLNLTDEAKLEKFHQLMVKKYQKDIQLLKRQIQQTEETLATDLDEANDILSEKEEERDTLSITIDPEKIEKRELRDAYIKTFDENLSIVLDNIDKQREYITNLQKNAEDLIKELNCKITLVKAKLSLLKVK